MSEEIDVTVDAEYIAPRPENVSNVIHVPQPSAIGPTQQYSGQGASMVATSLATVKLQFEMAKAYPRDAKAVMARAFEATQRLDFAEKCVYTFPRGGKAVTGPTIYLAEELAKLSTNMQWGSIVIDETEKTRTIRCFAWDMETNVRSETDTVFNKLIQRKRDNVTTWVEPDERDLLELHNRMAAKGVRNRIFAIIPTTLKRDAISWAAQTVKDGIARSPVAFKNQMMVRLAQYGVKYDMIEDLMGKPYDQIATTPEIEYIRSVGVMLNTGEKTWDEIMRERCEATGREPPAPRTAAHVKTAASAAVAATKPKGG